MSSLTETRPDRRFLTRLESLRGIAALFVAVAHSFVLFPYAPEAYPAQTAWQTAVHILSPGKSALIVFFIISGYVLSLSLDRTDFNFRNVLTFYKRRALRIYPAHVVWAFIALGLMAAFYTSGQIPAASAWVNDMYSGEMNIVHVIANLALIITSLNPGEWTLTVELIVYLLYPILYLLNRKSGKAGNILLLLFLMGLSFIGHDIKVLYYLYSFYIGLSAPSIYRRFIERSSQRKGAILLWASVVLLVLCPIVLTVFTFVATAGQVLAGGYLVFACVFMKTDSVIFRALDKPLVGRLGQISYSFYIIHFLINYWVAQILFGLLGSDVAGEFRFFFMLGVAVVSIAITYVLACWSYDKVEAPMMAYSRKPSGRDGEKGTLVASPEGQIVKKPA